jgi:hypothetical protein
MYQTKTIHQWAKHIKDYYRNSEFKHNLDFNIYDYNMNHLMDIDNHGNYIVSSEFVTNVKQSMGLSDSYEHCKMHTLYIDDLPVMVFNINPAFVSGESYNIIVNPRESISNCVYACKHFLTYN